MKKLLSFMVAVIAIVCCAQTADAQQRTEVAKSVYLTTYGNVTVIENDNLQQSIQIRVEKSDNLYEILCGNTVVKTVAKEALTQGITAVIQANTAIPRWVSHAVVKHIVSKIYDGVCNYYR